jgi:glycosyltransferase involved in cell wall biosynthesis/tetratricopeptide (TPR) repeat protein
MSDSRSLAPSAKDGGARGKLKLRVLAIDHHWSSARGGVGTFNRQLCIALANAGATVECLVLEPDDADLDEAQRAGVRLISADRLPGRPDDERLTMPPDTMIGLHPHLIIGHGLVTGAHALHFRDSYFTDAAYMHFVHTDPQELEWQRDPTEDPEGRLAQGKWEKEVVLMRAADRVLAVGPRLHDAARQTLRQFDNSLKVVRIDPGFDADTGTVRAPSMQPSMQILVTGRLGDTKIKGIDIAARAVAEAIRLLGKEGEKIRLLLRGARPGEKRKLREAVLGWARRADMYVTPLTYTTDAKALQDDLSSSDLVLMPSRAEGFGLAGLEAVAAGVPVLISARSGLAKLVEEAAPEFVGDVVVNVQCKLACDGEAWGMAIAAVLRDRGAAFARASVLRERMRTTYSWSAAAERVLQTLSVLPRRMKGIPEHPNHLSAFVCRTGIQGRGFERALSRMAGDLIDHVTPFTRVPPGDEHLTTEEGMDAVINKADVVLFVLTAESSRDTPTNPCVPLLQLARAHNKPVVVLRVKYAATPPIELPRSTLVDFSETLESGLPELAAQLAHIGEVARGPDLAVSENEGSQGSRPMPTHGFLSINDMPDIVLARFQDRKSQKVALNDALSKSGFRLIQLDGNNGIGKTALLRALRDDNASGKSTLPLRAFVYFSARGYRWITVATLLEDLATAGDPAGRLALFDAIRTSPWRHVVGRVVAVLERQPVAVVIDDADELFDSRGEWKDRELRELVMDLAARTADHEVKIVMSIRRAHEGRDDDPDDTILRRHTDRVSLDKGLPLPYAKSLLHSLDIERRLADATDEQLNSLLARTGGHPRALELTAGILNKHRVEQIDSISGLLVDAPDPAARLFAFLFDRLELDERRVVQALAIFARPVPVEAVTYLLKKLMPTLQTDVVLRTLRSCYLIHSYGDRYYLPSADASFVLSTLLTAGDADSSSALEQGVLWLRGAEYFESQHKGSPNRIEDLWPQFGQIELCHRALLWEGALRVMNDIDDRYLTRWGQSHVLSSWRKDLRNKLVEPSLEGLNLSHLVAARRQYEGHVDDVDDILVALGHAESIDDQVNAVVVNIQLANALIDKGRVAEAECLHREMITRAHGYVLLDEEIRAREGRATCLVKAGNFATAAYELYEAIRVADAIDPISERDELRTHLLVTRAWVARQRGDYWLAQRLLDEAHDLAQRIGIDLLLGTVLGGMAANALATTQVQRAIDLAVESASIGVRLDNHRLLRESALTRSLALLEMDDLPGAAEAADVGARYAQRPSAVGVLGVQGLVAFRQEDDEKARKSFGAATDLLLVWERIDGGGGQDYQLLDAKGMTLSGLALLGDSPVEDAVDAFGQARRITDAPGVVAHNDLILSQFGDRADEEVLRQLHHAACGDGYGGTAELRRLRP